MGINHNHLTQCRKALKPKMSLRGPCWMATVTEEPLIMPGLKKLSIGEESTGEQLISDYKYKNRICRIKEFSAVTHS